MHFAPAQDLIFADNGNVIFRNARHDASVAAVAAIEVDGHAPGVPGILEFLVQRKALGRSFVAFVGEAGVLLVFLERAGAENLAAFYVEVILRAA